MVVASMVSNLIAGAIGAGLAATLLLSIPRLKRRILGMLRERRARPRPEGWITKLLLASIPGLAAIVLYTLQFRRVQGLSVAGASVVLAGFAVLAGLLVGFLFGLPRTREGEQSATDQARYVGNTNLEQISDWLTKILVGVGLVQLGNAVSGLSRLGGALTEMLGGLPSSGAFGLALLAYFAIDGFFMGYLWSRLFFAGALRAQDVERVLDERQTANVEALTLLDRQLNPDPGAPPVTPQQLERAVEQASPQTRLDIFERAHALRKENWKDAPDVMARTIPVFQALIAADPNGSHRYHGSLGFALKDKQPPDYRQADIELTKAIELRGNWRSRGYWLYEFNRAVCRIELDERFQRKEPSDPATRERILQDLSVGGQFGDHLLQIDPVKRWRQYNQVSQQDLAPPS